MTLLTKYILITVLILFNALCIKGNGSDVEDNFSESQSIDINKYLKMLSPEEFKQNGQYGLWFIFFGSNASVKSETFTYMWLEIQNQADKENITSNINLGMVECTRYYVFCKENNIEYFPTLLLFNNGKREDELKDYENSDDVLDFIRNKIEVFSKNRQKEKVEEIVEEIGKEKAEEKVEEKVE
ncbi:hypothetical protein H8356DRAFT_1038215, partial [Neocallimastix lanati (nom. inval.)]